MKQKGIELFDYVSINFKRLFVQICVLFLIIGMVFIIDSCKKDKPVTPEPTPVICNPNFKRYVGEISFYQNSSFLSDDSNVFTIGKMYDIVSLLKMDLNGNLIWRKGSDVFSENVYPNSIVVNTNNDILISGNYLESTDSSSNFDIVAIKLTSSGDLVWLKRFGGNGNEYGHLLIKTFDNCFILCGRYCGNNVLGYDILLYKINTDGDTIWTKKYHDPEVSMYPQSIIELNDNGFFVVSTYPKYTTGSGTQYRSMLIKYNALGEIEWKSFSEYIYNSSYESNDNNILICGNNGNTGEHLYLKKISYNNQTIWGGSIYESNIYTNGTYIKESPNGIINVIVETHDNTQYYGLNIYKYDQNGVLLSKSPIIEGIPYHLHFLSNRNCIITGLSGCDNNRSVYFAKTDSAGNFINLNL